MAAVEVDPNILLADAIDETISRITNEMRDIDNLLVSHEWPSNGPVDFIIPLQNFLGILVGLIDHHKINLKNLYGLEREARDGEVRSALYYKGEIDREFAALKTQLRAKSNKLRAT